MRTANIQRNTNETQIAVAVNLDGTGRAKLNTSVPFLDHMLDQIARHGLIDLEITAQGDTHIDDHHTVEDIGIALGQALRQAWGDKTGICRYGHPYGICNRLGIPSYPYSSSIPYHGRCS